MKRHQKKTKDTGWDENPFLLYCILEINVRGRSHDIPSEIDSSALISYKD